MPEQTASKFISTADGLSQVTPLSEQEKEQIDHIRKTYPMLIPPYYASLIDGPDSPIRRQAVPSMEELDSPDYFEDDPLHEGNFSPVPYLVHKYPDRVAFFICNTCFMYCRHCTRKNTVIKNTRITKEQFEDVLAYLRKTPQVRDVLITGGDPFTLDDECQYQLIDQNYFLLRRDSRIYLVSRWAQDKGLNAIWYIVELHHE